MVFSDNLVITIKALIPLTLLSMILSTRVGLFSLILPYIGLYATFHSLRSNNKHLMVFSGLYTSFLILFVALRLYLYGIKYVLTI